MIFQRRGSHSSVLETTSPSLRSREPPHFPQAQGAGSTTRSTGRLSGSLRGPRGARRALRLGGFRRGDLGLGLFLGLRLFQVLDRQFELLDEKLAALGGLAKTLVAGLGQHQLQPLDLQRADLGFLLGLAQRRLRSASLSRCARIIACALARSLGSQSR